MKLLGVQSTVEVRENKYSNIVQTPEKCTILLLGLLHLAILRHKVLLTLIALHYNCTSRLAAGILTPTDARCPLEHNCFKSVKFTKIDMFP